MIDEIKNHQEGTKIWWAGHNSWIIKSGDLVVTTDIFLEPENRIEPLPITAEELAEVIDISFVTHWHGDHFNGYTSKILNENSECTFVLPESALEEAENFGLPDHRIVVAEPRESFEIEGIQVDALRAIHGNKDFAIYYQANLQDVGYKFTINGTSFVQPGDTYLLEDHLFLEDVDVLFVSPTEHNMYIDRSVILINRLNPDYIFPQHHSTLVVTDDNRFWADGYPHEVEIRLTDALKEKYHILEPGDSRVIE
ncbi:MBL fold metallo-hydrolase [Rhodohalobacter sulfatireducens]|uniref:MBL fold metallo-hydrolase n=1 Tax=Rhodohalobacter sulfatireducens TaxID=2911366 RepID=A0ABS9KD44_9BACT|nr:MBL fold metallo-hydrolase [Rhodohalobacter sulfatireducens]MCG2588771.1 MBL fold metallo-hydrolase [Rhodohalobacter sulfatireducens]